MYTKYRRIRIMVKKPVEPLPPGRLRRPGAGKKAAIAGSPNIVKIQSRISPQLYQQMEAAAASEGVTVAEMIRHVLTRYFEIEEQIL